ncbi:hypothetical protein ASG65_00920 [Bacillus sp. Leaf13]|nr:hypothetical protein ASG65_00920 [Bacillus sp. Leaf13]
MKLTSGESIEFAKLNAGVEQLFRTGINPYYLRLKIFEDEDIEERYNNPTEEMKRRGVKLCFGMAIMFEGREVEADISFLRNYLTNDLVMLEDMDLFQKQGNNIRFLIISARIFRDELVNMCVNGGFLYINVNDGYYLKYGELYLKHWFEGNEPGVKYLEKVISNYCFFLLFKIDRGIHTSGRKTFMA